MKYFFLFFLLGIQLAGAISVFPDKLTGNTLTIGNNLGIEAEYYIEAEGLATENNAFRLKPGERIEIGFREIKGKPPTIIIEERFEDNQNIINSVRVPVIKNPMENTKKTPFKHIIIISAIVIILTMLAICLPKHLNMRKYAK